MKKKTTVYEEKAAKEAKRRVREEEYRAKHLVSCPHCGKEMFDHMTKCPSCGKEVKPAGYTPMSEKKIKTIRLIGFLVGMVIVVIVFWYLFWRQ